MRNALHETEREATRDVGVGVYSAAFSPDGTRVATCHNDGVVQVWEVKPPGMRVGGAWDAGGHAARGSLIGMGSNVALDGTGWGLGTLAWDGGQPSSFEEWDVEHGG